MASNIATLRPGATIGVVSSGSAAKDPAGIERGKAFLESHGFKVIVHPQTYMVWPGGHLSGSDEARAGAIMDLFRDPSIDAILSRGGGNGSIRLLDMLDYDVIRQNPKPFIGFSDVTVLLHAIHRKTGMITYHGPMLSFNFGDDALDQRTLQDFTGVLSGQQKELEYDAEVLQPGMAEGILLGGNLTMLQSILSTPYDWPDDRPVIFFFEDVDEVLYRLDRMLSHMKLAGKFKNVAAILVGEMVDVPDGETSFLRAGERKYGPTFEEILTRIFPNIPIATGLPCGHAKYMTTLPVGALAKVAIKQGKTTLSF